MTADSVTSSRSRAPRRRAQEATLRFGVTNLVVLGASVAATPNAKITLGDWGYAIALEQAVTDQNTTQRRGHRGFVVGLHVHLTADHGGLPAGTEIFIGYAEAAATAPKASRIRRRALRLRARRDPHDHEPAPPPAGAPPRASSGAESAAGGPAAPDRRRLRLPGLRAGLVLGRLRGRPRRHGLAPRQRHLRAARRAGPRGHGRDTLPRRLEHRSAATASGSATCRGTSSTTPTCLRTPRWRGTARR